MPDIITEMVRIHHLPFQRGTIPSDVRMVIQYNAVNIVEGIIGRVGRRSVVYKSAVFRIVGNDVCIFDISSIVLEIMMPLNTNPWRRIFRIKIDRPGAFRQEKITPTGVP